MSCCRLRLSYLLTHQHTIPCFFTFSLVVGIPLKRKYRGFEEGSFFLRLTKSVSASGSLQPNACTHPGSSLWWWSYPIAGPLRSLCPSMWMGVGIGGQSKTVALLSGSKIVCSLSPLLFIHASCSWEPSGGCDLGKRFSFRDSFGPCLWAPHISYCSCWGMPILPTSQAMTLACPSSEILECDFHIFVAYLKPQMVFSHFFFLAFLDSWKARSQARGKNRYALQRCRSQRRYACSFFFYLGNPELTSRTN